MSEATPEQVERFTRVSMDWGRWSGLIHMVLGKTMMTDAWFWDARNALELLNYYFRKLADNTYMWAAPVHDMHHFDDTPESAVLAAIAHWCDENPSTENDPQTSGANPAEPE